jgi:hypothetical protein
MTELGDITAAICIVLIGIVIIIWMCERGW